MDWWAPVTEVWNKLPWNKKSPTCNVSVIFIDEEMRIVKDTFGSIFVYIRTIK